jgi:predicted NUDIX family phosphoesterase
LLSSIYRHHTFLPREQIEEDEEWQQIIPYIVFFSEGLFLLLKRLSSSSERRLHHLYSLGLGGHINPAPQKDPLMAGFWKEWREEVEYNDGMATQLVGMIKDTSKQVSRVHLGLFYLVRGESPRIKVVEERKMEATLLPLERIKEFYSQMESWSQIVFDYLKRAFLQ